MLTSKQISKLRETLRRSLEAVEAAATYQGQPTDTQLLLMEWMFYHLCQVQRALAQRVQKAFTSHDREWPRAT